MSNYENKIIELKNKHFDLLIENITSTIVPCDLSDETIRLLTNWRGKYNIFLHQNLMFLKIEQNSG